MILHNDEEIRIIPVRKSLTRPQLICGCDRVLFLLLMLVCITLIFPGGIGAGNYVNVIIGIAFFLIGVQVLAVLAKYDPLLVKFSAELLNIRTLMLLRLMFQDLIKNIKGLCGCFIATALISHFCRKEEFYFGFIL